MNKCFPTGRAYPALLGLPCKTPWRKQNICFFDCETTGLNPAEDRIWSIALAFSHELETFSWEFNPECELHKEVQTLCGKEGFDFSSLPTFGEVWPEIEATIDGCQMAAYNARFDKSFLLAETDRAGYAYPTSPWIDPLTWARELLPKPHKLTQVAHKLGLPSWQAHEALGDAVGGLSVLQALAPQLPEDLCELLYEQKNLEYQYFLKTGRK
jgi:DNA polymerase-3 subunit epsilon